MKKRVMLIAGCSNAAGSEIDGTQDSFYNRQHSFPTLLSDRLGRFHVHAALVGATNPTIARSVQEWFLEKYDPDTMDVFVLLAWTDSSRIEIPSESPIFYEHQISNEYFSKSSLEYHKVNIGYRNDTEYKVLNDDEQYSIDLCRKFMVTHPVYLEIVTANAILQTQYFLKMHNVKYLMCNTLYLFETRSQINWYKNLIDKNHYIDFDNNSQCFVEKYKKLGFVNPNAKYYHHGEEPHKLYAEYLHNYIIEHNLDPS